MINKKRVGMGAFILIILATISLVCASSFIDDTQAEFDSGTYSNTFYNTSGFVQLNASQTSGNYTSQVFDAGGTSQWNNISWTQGVPYQQELLDNAASESDLGGIDMTGNVLLLHMNNNWNDASGEGNNGTASGAIFTTLSKLGSHAGSFDGTNDKVTCGSDSSLNLRYTLTVSAWIKLDTVTPAHSYHSSIIGDNTNSNWWFYVGNNAKLGFLRFKGTYDAIGSNSNISAGTWTHVAATYNNSAANEAKLFINGQLDKQGSLDGPIDALGGPIVVGDRGDAHRLDGLIDELAVWNRTLSDDEILNIYKRGTLKLNLTARSCNDSNCSGENFTDITDTSPQNLGVANNTYFQYKFAFETDNATYSPELYNVTIDYTIPDTTAPTISSTSPTNGASLSSGTTSTVISLTTDEIAVCRYNTSDVSWDNMTQLNNTNSTTHNFTVTGLSDGNTYDYYFLCEDDEASPNRMNASHHLQFSVSSSGGGNGGSSGGGGSSTPTTPIIPPEETCTESWICEDWSECIDGMRTRTCIDFYSCGTALNKPSEIELCDVVEEEPKELFLEKGLTEYTLTVSATDKIYFDYAGETHQITILEITDKVSITITSEPINVDLLLYQSVNVDIDGDEIPDIRLMLNMVQDGQAEIILRFISPGITSITGETIAVLPYDTPNVYYLIPTILLLIIFIVLVSVRKSHLSAKTKKFITILHITLMGIILLLFFTAFIKNLPVGAFLTNTTITSSPAVLNKITLSVIIFAVVIAVLSAVLLFRERKKIETFLKKKPRGRKHGKGKRRRRRKK